MAYIGSIQKVTILVSLSAESHTVLVFTAEKARRDSRIGRKQGHGKEAKEGKLEEEVHDAKDETKSKGIRVSALALLFLLQ